MQYNVELWYHGSRQDCWGGGPHVGGKGGKDNGKGMGYGGSGYVAWDGVWEGIGKGAVTEVDFRDIYNKGSYTPLKHTLRRVHDLARRELAQGQQGEAQASVQEEGLPRSSRHRDQRRGGERISPISLRIITRRRIRQNNTSFSGRPYWARKT